MVDPVDVCTLSGSGWSERVEWVRREIVPHAVGSERLADGLALELRDEPGLAAKLDAWSALERDCCAALSFERRESAIPGRLRFEIHGVDPDAATFAALRADVGPGSAQCPSASRTGSTRTSAIRR